MSLNSDRVKIGYAELSESEKTEVRSFIKEYDQSGTYGQQRMFSNLNESKSLGPTSGNRCPQCGK